VTEKGRNDELRVTNDEGNVVKTSTYTHTLLSLCTYSAVAGYLQKGNCSDRRRVIRYLRETRRRGTIETQGELW